jgi:heptosyltransferase-2
MADGPSILVIGPRWVGDMVMAQTLFSALKQVHPDAAIDVMAPAWAGPLVARMPEIRDFIDAPFARKKLEFGLRRRIGRSLAGRYDRAIVMQGNWKAALLPWFAGIRRRSGYRGEMRFGLVNDMATLPADQKRKTAEAFFRLAGGGTFRPPNLSVDEKNQTALLAGNHLTKGGFAAFMPGAEFGPAKRWPEENYAALARSLIAGGLPVVLLGSANDRAVTGAIARQAPGAIDLAGATRLVDAVDLLAAARVAVTNDSGLMHIAAAVGTPVVAVYGSTSPENTPPLTDRRELVWLKLDCSPCHKRECPLGHMNCLRTLDVRLVEDAVRRATGAGTPA